MIFVIVMMLTLVLATTLVGAHEDDGTGDSGENYDHHGGHMVGWWADPTPLELIIAYLVLALPIGLLVYIDSQHRGMNSALWFLLVLVPAVGLIVALVYLMVRGEERPQYTGSPSHAQAGYLPQPYNNSSWTEKGHSRDDRGRR
jgi:hypothetical protein